MRTAKHLIASASIAAALGMLCSIGVAGESDSGEGANLVAFIGRKISLEEVKTPPCPNCFIMNAHFVATYQIDRMVFGDYRDRAITFDVHDHYGKPAFSEYDTVLLFVSRQPDGSWVHEKYQFYDLYEGTDGEWYGCGDPYRYTPRAGGAIHAKPVQFRHPVSYPLDGLPREQVERDYPAGYFEIRDGRAYCLRGTPVPELFQAKKETVLTARGIFKQKPSG